MNRPTDPHALTQASTPVGTHAGYMPGFGNDFETEALPGALPQGMNSPQKCNYGLYGEQLSGTAFTANPPERTWCYRIRPSVKHSHRYEKIDLPYWKSAPNVDPDVISLGQYRWDAVPHSDQPLTWLTGMRTMTTAGDVNTQVGMASHIYLVTESMVDDYFFSADSELLVVPQEGRLRFATELGIIDLEPKEIAIIPRGLVYRVEVLEGPCRGFVCENYGQKFELPGRGPIGANCMANPRDFKAPVAAFEDREVPSTVTIKWCGQFHDHQDRPQPAGRGGLARQLRALQIRPAHLLPGRRDPVRPPRSVDLYRADRAFGRAGHGQYRLRPVPRTLDGDGGHVPPAVVPQEHHVRADGQHLRPV